jgi:hypothetical protein
MKVEVNLVTENLAHARGGEVVLYKRGDSKKWQARFKLKDLKWHRVATKQQNLQYAAQTACEAYDRARFLFDAKVQRMLMETTNPNIFVKSQNERPFNLRRSSWLLLFFKLSPNHFQALT